jgi:hypothetical protein
MGDIHANMKNSDIPRNIKKITDDFSKNPTKTNGMLYVMLSLSEISIKNYNDRI